jgi:hypothetical protein
MPSYSFYYRLDRTVLYNKCKYRKERNPTFWPEKLPTSVSKTAMATALARYDSITTTKRTCTTKTTTTKKASGAMVRYAGGHPSSSARPVALSAPKMSMVQKVGNRTNTLTCKKGGAIQVTSFVYMYTTMCMISNHVAPVQYM